MTHPPSHGDKHDEILAAISELKGALTLAVSTLNDQFSRLNSELENLSAGVASLIFVLRTPANYNPDETPDPKNLPGSGYM